MPTKKQPTTTLKPIFSWRSKVSGINYFIGVDASTGEHMMRITGNGLDYQRTHRLGFDGLIESLGALVSKLKQDNIRRVLLTASQEKKVDKQG